MNKNIRGQFWSFDVIFSVVIFSFAITILSFTWFNINGQLSIAYGNGAGIMQLQLQSLSQNLMSPGSPGNWQSTISTTNPATWSAVSIGITNGRGSYVISPSKLYTFISMADNNYQASKQTLGVGFDYYITIQGSSELGSNLDIAVGSNPASGGALTTYVDNVAATLNGVPVNVQIILWTNTTLAVS